MERVGIVGISTIRATLDRKKVAVALLGLFVVLSITVVFVWNSASSAKSLYELAVICGLLAFICLISVIASYHLLVLNDPVVLMLTQDGTLTWRTLWRSRKISIPKGVDFIIGPDWLKFPDSVALYDLPPLPRLVRFAGSASVSTSGL